MSQAIGDIYRVGDRDNRPWGSYIVTGTGQNAAGEEFCTKDITVKPQGILSLQSHDQRRETWTVKSGELTVILDGQRLTLKEGENVKIPLQAIHCMANLADAPCVVSELQEGVCREADIRRYVDANGRATETANSAQGSESVRQYKLLEQEIAAGKSGQAADATTQKRRVSFAFI